MRKLPPATRAGVMACLKHAGSYDESDLAALSVVFGAFTEAGCVAALGGLACYHGFWCLRLAVVHPDHRGHGLQRALIRARLRWLRRRGAPHVNVWVDPGNTYSLNNLVSEGFRFVGHGLPPRIFHRRPHFKLRRVL